MNSRIAKKIAERWTCAGLTLPYVLAHARPSFFAIRDVGSQRRMLAERMGMVATKPSVARYVARHSWPIDAAPPLTGTPNEL